MNNETSRSIETETSKIGNEQHNTATLSVSFYLSFGLIDQVAEFGLYLSHDGLPIVTVHSDCGNNLVGLEECHVLQQLIPGGMLAVGHQVDDSGALLSTWERPS